MAAAIAPAKQSIDSAAKDIEATRAAAKAAEEEAAKKAAEEAAKQAAEEQAAIQAAESLAAAKTAAKDRVDDYFDAKKPANLSKEEEAAYEAAREAAKDSIDAATSKDEVAAAIAPAKQSIDNAAKAINDARAEEAASEEAAKQAAEEAAKKAAEEAAKQAAEEMAAIQAAESLAAAKTTAKDRVDDYFDAKKPANLSKEEEAAYEAAKAAAKDSIDAATTKDAVAAAIKPAKASIDKAAKEITDARTAADAAAKKAAEEAAKKAAEEEAAKKAAEEAAKKAAEEAAKKAAEEAKLASPEAKAANALALNSGLKVSQTGSKLNVSWGAVEGAEEYGVFVQYCGKKFAKKATATTKTGTTSVKIKKLNGKSLKLKKNYKIYVVAYRTINGKKTVVGKTLTAHVVGRKNTKYSNPKKLTIKSSKAVTLSVGKTSKIKAKVTLVSKNRKSLSNAHAKKFRYASTDTSVAKVSSSGKITAVGKGTCTIYVYARNGYAKTVTVTVK